MRLAVLAPLLVILAAGCHPTPSTGAAGAAGLHRDADVFAAVGRLLDSARARVWVEMYEFGRPDLAERLVALERRGLDVRLISDPTVDVSRATASRLARAGVPLRLYPVDDALHQIDHVKLLLVDRTALVGGMNWGATSARNHDYALEVRAPPDVDRLQAIYEHDWAVAGGGLPAAVPPDGGSIVETTPGEEIRDRLLGLIGAARIEADVEVFVLSDPDVIAALAGAHRRGVPVRVLLDPNQDSNDASCALLHMAGVDVAWFPVAPGQKLHAKAGLFDGTLLVGSANWSVSGLDSNHELDAVTRLPAQTSAFRAWFTADWARAHPWWEPWLGLAC